VSDAPAIPVICGPTASGKTSLALEIAQTFPIEVVSADSRQIIRRLDIGTAKPTPEERTTVVFHLIDLIEPGDRYSAYRFIEDSHNAIEGILARQHIPLVVGGTGLYLRALTDGVVEIQEEDQTVRQKLEQEMQELGPEKMHRRLAEIDPLEARRIHPNNRVRVIRALEIYYLTGKSKSELAATGAYRKSEHDFSLYCLLPPRQALYHAIDARVDRMMATGWLEEVRQLCQEGARERVRRASIIGYMEILDYLEGRTSPAEAASRIKQNTRRYAKRQITWFRNQLEGCFFADAGDLLSRLKADLSRRTPPQRK
jgi:tRNA dimethylallyltransferase